MATKDAPFTCSECRERLSEFLTESLDPLAVDAFEAHVASCPTCATELERLEDTLGAFDALPVLSPGVEFTNETMALIEGEVSKSAKPRRIVTAPSWSERLFAGFRRLSPVAALCALGLLALFAGGVFDGADDGAGTAIRIAELEGTPTGLTCRIDGGEASLLRPSGTSACWVTLLPGMERELLSGDRLEVNDEGDVTLAYATKRASRGTIALSSNTRLVAGVAGVSLASGKGFFDLTLRGGTFDVDTPGGQVHVTGTRFEVAILPDDEVSVRVEEGTVEFKKEGTVTPITAGKTMMAAYDGLPEIVVDAVARSQPAAEPTATPVRPVHTRVPEPVDGPSGRPVAVTTGRGLEHPFDEKEQ